MLDCVMFGPWINGLAIPRKNNIQSWMNDLNMLLSCLREHMSGSTVNGGNLIGNKNGGDGTALRIWLRRGRVTITIKVESSQQSAWVKRT